jgi:hypothetical protein
MIIYCPSLPTLVSINEGDYVEYPAGTDVRVTPVTLTYNFFVTHFHEYWSGQCNTHWTTLGVKSKLNDNFFFLYTIKTGSPPTVEETFLANIDSILENGYPGSLNLSVSRRGGYVSYCGNGNYSQWDNYLNGVQTTWQYPSGYDMYVGSYSINVYDLLIITP